MPAGGYVIHIIDDDDAVRRTLKLLVRSAGFFAETYSSASQYLAHGPVDREGCVLLDVRMPEMDGLVLLERLAEARPALPVVMMTGHGDIETAVQAMKLGAVEFLEKPFTDDDLFAAIGVAQQRASTRFVSDDMVDASTRLARLSRREGEILAALAAGQPQKMIANDLGISVRTVEVHRARMMRRLGIRSLAEAVRLFVLASLQSNGETPIPIAPHHHPDRS